VTTRDSNLALGEAHQKSPLFPHAGPGDTAALRAFCFPHAGGTASYYLPWRALALPAIELLPIQYAGRETRIREPAPAGIAELAAEAAAALRTFTERPYVLYGHSMGALIAYEAACRLRELGCPPPARLVVSGCASPPLFRLKRAWHELGDAELMQVLLENGGTPSALLDAPELVSLIATTARADFSICHSYVFRPAPPLDAPIVGLAGMDDDCASPLDVQMWCEHTSTRFELHVFPGGHFFHTAAVSRVLSLMLGQGNGSGATRG
jgi:medium-chain acyl-[acyl-carrier-protein] hydrolase